MESIWNNAPLLRDAIPSSSRYYGPKREQDMWRFWVGDSVASAIPIGDGSKIRGQRANDIIADEFASIPQEIFENVIAGFAAVSANPIENVIRMATQSMAKKFDVYSEEEYAHNDVGTDNQIIIAGTAYYDFNHFASYWKDWKAIIKTKGEPKKVLQFFQSKNQDKQLSEEDIPEDFHYEDYLIFRIPFSLVPKGFMDDAQVARSRATIHAGIYQMEFGAAFSTDSNGFYKRSLIETCVVSPANPICHPSGEAMFTASLRGAPNGQYVFGVDPASEVDNFSIIILEIHQEHRRVVYAWTTNRKEHVEKVKAGLAKETDFYSYCARKIRELMVKFPCLRIAMDSQGGGIAVMEALHDIDKLKAGERLIYPIIDPKKPQITDPLVGDHIIEMINFASSDWTSESNHGMRKDLEDKALIFQYFDGIE